MWHLLCNNLRGRKNYNALIVSAAALAFMVALVSALMTWDMEKELERKQRLLGPELALVPPGTKESGHIYLTKGPPGHGWISIRAVDAARQFPEIEAVTVQKLLGSEPVGEKVAIPIAFDPATDFMVLPWSEKARGNFQLTDGNDIVLGSDVMPEARVGGILELAGKSYIIADRLGDTGTFMNGAIFFPRPAGDFGDKISWVLLRLRQGVSVDMMINKLETNIENIEVIARPEMLKTINDQLVAVAQGGSLNAAAILVVLGAMLVAGAMFALFVYERRREFGLLKAMGAKNSFVFKLIIGEAVILGGMGAAIGAALSVTWLLASGTTIMPTGLSFPAGLGFVLNRVSLALALTVGVGTMTALLPALLIAGMEPYEAIRRGE